jgi:cytochrome b6-f complex iron-sulfur subunit
MGKKENKIAKEQAETTRRSFLNRIWVWLGVIALAELGVAALAFLASRKARAQSEESEAIIEAGLVERFSPGSVTAFVRGKFYLCCLEDGGFLALSCKCTHLGCTVPWEDEEKKFACPCHGSVFDIHGEVLSPPAPRALDLYQVFIENDVVKVATDRRIKRSAFKEDQVVYAIKKT